MKRTSSQGPVPGTSCPPDAPAHTELILGGQRSGKSRRAEWLAQQWLAVRGRQALFIATAQPHDDEMAARIRRHQADRAACLPGMGTLEEPLALAEAIHAHSEPNVLLVIDCLTLWLANHDALVEGFCDSDPARHFLLALEQRCGPVVMVSNEIGLGVVPLGREVRAYVDALGWLNQQVAARCDRVCLMAAGLPLWLKGGKADALRLPPEPEGSISSSSSSQET